jgi:cell division protein FtsW
MNKSSGKIDKQLLGLTLALLGFGLMGLYSASTVQSFQNFGNTTHYIVHQMIYGGGFGLLTLLVLSKIDYHFWQKNLPWLIFLSLFLLALVKVPGLGFSSGGASRWIQYGPIFFQPSELAKLVIIFYLASWAERKQRTLNNFYFGVLPSLIIVGLFALLVIWQPDMGTTLVLMAVSLVMLFAGGINWKYLSLTIVAGLLALYGLVKLAPYRAQRLTTFLDRSVDPQGISYQINQALLAIGSGGLFGYGYGLSRQKHNYLPQVMGDSVFAVTAEELGFLGASIMILLFCLFALKGFAIAKRAPDLFGKMVAFGITSWIVIQTLINIGAMVHLLPLTGIPLPFFSYGSTALIMILAALGILLNISKHSTHKA